MQLRAYQKWGVRYILRKPYCGLFLGMGLGKTVICLTALRLLLREEKISKVLVIGPKRTAEYTWPEESRTFDHLKDLRLVSIAGTAAERLAATRRPAEVYTIGVDNLLWLARSYRRRHFPFDALVIDEASYFKNQKSKRFAAITAMRPYFKRVVLLTGTPGSLLDLWALMYIMDEGKRLGASFTRYRNKYFRPDKGNGQIVYSWTLRRPKDTLLGPDIFEKEIYDKVDDVCISMDTRAYVELPPFTQHTINITLPVKIQSGYEQFERDQVLLCPEISVANAASLCGKLTQYASGAVYDDMKVARYIHSEKIDAVKELIAEAGEPVLVFYWYQHELERLHKALSGHKVVAGLKHEKDLKAWNAGKIDVLLLHPRSAGHGLNLQFGGRIIVWYSLPNWSAELFKQANARLDRSGQNKAGMIYKLIVSNTIEVDMLQVITGKHRREGALLAALQARVDKWK